MWIERPPLLLFLIFFSYSCNVISTNTASGTLSIKKRQQKNTNKRKPVPMLPDSIAMFATKKEGEGRSTTINPFQCTAIIIAQQLNQQEVISNRNLFKNNKKKNSNGTSTKVYCRPIAVFFLNISLNSLITSC